MNASVFIAVILLGLTAPVFGSESAVTAASGRELEADIAAFAARSGGVVGVAAWRLDERGPRVLMNGSERFPMASTFKIAVAAAVFAEVDAGRVRLDQPVALDPRQFVPSEVIAERFIHPGVSLSVHNLLELMLTESDNTATDALVALVGGPQAVTAWLRQRGIQGQRVDRDTAGLLRDFFGLPAGSLPEMLAAAAKSDPDFEKRARQPNPAFDNDPRDTSTPDAMAQLLTAIFNGQALSPASTQELTAIMERCRTGKSRLKGLLPEETVVAHKTGTLGGSANDVGVITLPREKGRIALAVFITKSALKLEERERIIAEIARSVRDFYAFAP